MAAADSTNNTEQQQRSISNLSQHQQKNKFCDFTLTINNTSIVCHKVALSSASSYFSQLLSDFEHNTKILPYKGREIYYIGNDRCMYQYVTTASTNKCVKMINIPESVDAGSAVASHRQRMVIVGGFNRGAGDKRVLLIDTKDGAKVTQLPDLPEPCWNTSVLLSDNDVYVVGGDHNKSGFLSSVYYLSLGSDAWRTTEPLPHAIQSALVIQHQQCIYVLGGNNNSGCLSSVSQYNIKDGTWKRCSDMLEACDNSAAGVVVHKNRIKVITVDECMSYADDTDTWTVKQYHERGEAVNAFVRGGQIYAVVEDGDTHTMLSYDDVDNRWKLEHGRIDSARCSWLFC